MNKNEYFVERTGQSGPRSSTAMSRSFFSSISTTPFVVSILLSVAAVTFSVPLNADNEEAFLFLREYGFLDDIEGSLSTDNATVLSRALSLFQEYYKLSGNGVLTLRLMRKGRCGVRDIPNQAISGRKWPRTHLTWNFQLANKHLLQIAETAFALWTANSSLTFERNTLHPDILISYRDGAHTFADQKNGEICPEQFDGAGRVLAHAYFPTGSSNYVSEVHINHAEPWHIYLNKNPPNTYHLLQVLTHEIGHALGILHGTRRDSVMYAFVPSSGNQFPVKLSIEDILAVQNLYGPKDEKHVSTTPTTIPVTTTTIIAPTTTKTATPDNPSDTDLCALRHLDAALILNRRMYIARQRTVWSVSLNERIYGKPMSLPDYMTFLPANFTRLSAVYQRPSGDLAIFVDNSIYMVKNPSFTLRQDWPKTLADIRLPPNAKINAAINTNTGRTFVIYDDDKVAEIDECTMMVTKHSPIQEIFPGIPSAVTSAFRHIDGTLFFFTKRQFYVFNEFTNTVITGGPFDLYALGIECPRNGLMLQIRNLLDRIYRIGRSEE